MTSTRCPSKLDQILAMLEHEDLPSREIAVRIGSPVRTTVSMLWTLYRRELVVPMARDGADWWGVA